MFDLRTSNPITSYCGTYPIGYMIKGLTQVDVGKSYQLKDPKAFRSDILIIAAD